MKIYTKRGDTGDTDLFGGGKRIRKDSLRIEAIGNADELNAQVGIMRSLKPDHTIEAILEKIQHQLFQLGADLATPLSAPVKVDRVQVNQIEDLELHIDEIEAQLAPLTAFILPGGTPAASQLHLARAVCRRT